MTNEKICDIICFAEVESRGENEYGGLAQLGEHLPYKQEVTGSSPVVPTRKASRKTCFFYPSQSLVVHNLRVNDIRSAHEETGFISYLHCKYITEGKHKMITEKSCGAIVYTIANNKIKYVIIRSKEGIYGFPKGHMEGTEREPETALREIFEETGLIVNLIEGFRTEDSYTFIFNNETRLKHIVYFLAEYSGQVPKIQDTELSNIQLMEYEKAISELQFGSSKRILSEAHKFLTQQFLTQH